jgi:hypothetical protein
LVTARLVASTSDFEVAPTEAREMIVVPDLDGIWNWQVTAKHEGKGIPLTLEVVGRVQVGGRDTETAGVQIHKKIAVNGQSLSLTDRGTEAIGSTVAFVGFGGLVAICGGAVTLWRHRRRKQGQLSGDVVADPHADGYL